MAGEAVNASSRRRLVATLAAFLVAAIAVALTLRARTRAVPVAVVDAGGGEPAALEGVRFSGCAAVTAAGVCEIAPNASLRVWVAARAWELTFQADGVAVSPSSVTTVRDGTLALLPVGAAHTFEVRVAHRARTLALALEREKPPALRKAAELRAADKLAAAREVLEADRGRAEQAGEAWGVVGLLARIALAQARYDDADRLFDESIRLAEAAGRRSEAADDAFSLVFSLMSRVRLVEAHRVLARADVLSRGYPDGVARVRYYTASILAMSAQSREALRECHLAEDETARLGLSRLGRMARQLEAAILDDLGRAADALALLDEDERTSQMEPCDLADLFGLRGIFGMHARDPEAVGARASLVKAIDQYKTRCPTSYDPARVANLEAYLARAELRLGHLTEAATHLRASALALPHPRVEVLLERLATQAELAAARHDPSSSLAAWDEMASKAREIGNDDFLRSALDGRARALSALGRDADALVALEQAGELTDRLLVSIPIGEGRESFAGDQERDEARRVELLVRLKRPQEAAREVERIASRMLGALENADRLGSLSAAATDGWLEAAGRYRREREALENEAADDWKLSKETLDTARSLRATRAASARAVLDAALATILKSDVRRTLVPSPSRAVTLSLIPVERGWLGLITSQGATRAVSLGNVDRASAPDVLAKAILEPFRAELAAAPRLAVVSLGVARGVDVHALPWDGEPLIAKMPVVYPSGRGSPSAPGEPSGGVLVVGDPTSDLAAARDEVRDVTEKLRAAGEAKVAVLAGSNATGAAVRAAIADVRLFHYAGHGAFAGRDGWQSALPLAEHSELSVADILALPHAPEAVVLLGCETARTSEGAQAQGLGIAQAFLVAGSRAVVASMRVVDDAAAGAMARALYTHLRPGTDLAEALRAAQIDAWKKGVPDYGAFRVLLR